MALPAVPPNHRPEPPRRRGPGKLRDYNVADGTLANVPGPMDDSHIDRHVASGVQAPSWRRLWVATGTDVLRCPDGHRFRDTQLVWQEGCLRCEHRETPGGPPCGLLVYLVGGGLVTPRGQPLVILASVTPAEMRRMSAEHMDHDRALEFLGIRFPTCAIPPAAP